MSLQRAGGPAASASDDSGSERQLLNRERDDGARDVETATLEVSEGRPRITGVADGDGHLEADLLRTLPEQGVAHARQGLEPFRDRQDVVAAQRAVPVVTAGSASPMAETFGQPDRTGLTQASLEPNLAEPSRNDSRP